MFKRVFDRIGLLNHNVYLAVVVILASISLLLMNYYTIRVLSGTRAYIHGESLYSKGQKDATISLLLFIETEDNKYWEQFNQKMKAPLGDRSARIALVNKNHSGARKGLLQGGNDPKDLELIIWLFSSFNKFEFMKEPISLWEKGDALIMKQANMGQNIYDQLNNNTLTTEAKLLLKTAVFELNSELTYLEIEFLESLGRTSRKTSLFILLMNTILILTILIGKSLFSLRAIKNLVKSENHLLQQNKKIKSTNDELDRFVYSASHDLRAPITSLKGLVDIMKSECTSASTRNYLQLMDKTLNKQDVFIKKIIDFSKNKRADIQFEAFNLNHLVDEVLSQFQFFANFSDIKVKKTILKESIKSDTSRIEIILNNLISNAIKYADTKKAEKWITIEASRNDNTLLVKVKDNGIGIKESSLDKIFDQFYRSVNSADGSGVGLYIVKETINKLNGSIKVDSTIGVGTSFIFTVPIQK